MPFTAGRPTCRTVNPTGVYEREFEVPAAWAGRRVVLHVGAAESVLIVSLNGETVGVGKDSHLASEFDLTDRLRTGANTLTLRVVKWSDATYIEDQDQWWHGGVTRAGLPVRDRRCPSRRHPGRRRPGGRPRDRHARPGRHGRVPGPALPPRLDRRGARSTGSSVAAQRARPERRPAARSRAGRAPTSELMWRHRRRRCRCRTTRRPPGRACTPGWRRRSTGSSAGTSEVPGTCPWSAEQPRLYDLTVTLRDPDGAVAEEATHPDRLPAGRDPRPRPARQRRSGCSSAASTATTSTPSPGADRHPRADARRPRPDEAVRVQRRADIALPERPGVPGAHRRARAVRHRRGGHRVPRVLGHAVRRPPLPLGVGSSGCRGWCSATRTIRSVILWSLGNESGHGPNHEAAAGWLRRYDPSPAAPLRGGHPLRLGERPDISDIACPMYPPIARSSRMPGPGRQRHPADHVRVLARDGQQQRHAGRVLGRDRGHARAPGRLHLGVAGPRPATSGCRTAPTRWAYGGDFGDGRTTATSVSMGWTGRTAGRSPRCGSTTPSRPRSGSRAPRPVSGRARRDRATASSFSDLALAPGATGELARRWRGGLRRRDLDSRHLGPGETGGLVLPGLGPTRRDRRPARACPHGPSHDGGAIRVGVAGLRGLRGAAAGPCALGGIGPAAATERRRRAGRARCRRPTRPSVPRRLAGPVALARADRQRPDRRDGRPMGGLGRRSAPAPARVRRARPPRPRSSGDTRHGHRDADHAPGELQRSSPAAGSPSWRPVEIPDELADLARVGTLLEVVPGLDRFAGTGRVRTRPTRTGSAAVWSGFGTRR